MNFMEFVIVVFEPELEFTTTIIEISLSSMKDDHNSCPYFPCVHPGSGQLGGENRGLCSVQRSLMPAFECGVRS